MELTQLKWQDVWKKLKPLSLSPLKIWNLSGDSAEIKNDKTWESNLSPIGKSPVFLNWNKISNSTKINLWDTISVGEKHDLVLWAHKLWENISTNQVNKHISKLNLSEDEIDEIMKKLFSLKDNEKLKQFLIIFTSIIFILFIWIAILFLNIKSINSQISKKQTEAQNLFDKINGEVDVISQKLWLSDCEDGECQKEKDTISYELEEVSKQIKKLKWEQKKMVKSFKEKIAKMGSWSFVLDINKNTETVEKLDETFWQVVLGIKKDIKDLDEKIKEMKSSIKKELSSFKEFKNSLKLEAKSLTKFSRSFEVELNKIEQRFWINERKVTEAEKNIKKLERSDDNFYVEIKKLKIKR